MYLIVISSNPNNSSSYEQGLEIAMTTADFEKEIAVLLEGDFEEQCEVSDLTVFKKKLKQLSLFDIDIFSSKKLPNVESKIINKEAISHLLSDSQGILVF